MTRSSFHNLYITKSYSLSFLLEAHRTAFDLFILISNAIFLLLKAHLPSTGHYYCAILTTFKIKTAM